MLQLRLVAMCTVISGLLGCATLSAGGEQVRLITHAESVTHCRAVGQVEGTSMWGGAPSNAGHTDAEVELRNQAALMGADAVLVIADASQPVVAHLVGTAYVCAGAPAAAQQASAPAALDAPSKMLVLDLKAIGEVQPRVSRLVTDMLLARLAEVPNLSTLGASDIEAMLSAEKQKDVLTCSNVTCMAELGGALGTDLVLYGGIGNLGSSYTINLTVVDSAHASARARVSATVAQHEDDLPPAVPLLVADLVSRLNAPPSQ